MKINIEFDVIKIPKWLGKKIWLNDKLYKKFPVIIKPVPGQKSAIDGEYYIDLNMRSEYK